MRYWRRKQNPESGSDQQGNLCKYKSQTKKCDKKRKSRRESVVKPIIVEVGSRYGLLERFIKSIIMENIIKIIAENRGKSKRRESAVATKFVVWD